MESLVGRSFVFTTPYDQYRDREGQEARVIGEVSHDKFDYEECGPMYYAEFLSDNAVLEVWPEEIDPSLMDYSLDYNLPEGM